MSTQALRSADIVQEIVETIANSEDGCTAPEQPGQLASLARVCKLFYTPALKALWARPPSLRPLLCLLPEFDAAYRAYVASKSTAPFQCHLTDAISPEVWARFKEHAAVVKVVYFDHRPSFRRILSVDSWAYLKRLSADTPLFPTLRTLVWEPTPTCEDLVCLASPSLSRISLHCTWNAKPGTEHIPADALQTVLTTSPALISLKLSDFDCNFLTLIAPTALHRLKDVSIGIKEINRLSRVSWTPPGFGYTDANSIRVLSTLPALKALELDIRADGSKLDFQGFRALEKLRITAHGGDVAALLVTRSSSNLRELSFTSSEGMLTPNFSWHQLHPFCSAVASGFPRLEQLVLLFMAIRDVGRSPEATLAALSPLLSLRHLTSVQLWSLKEVIEFSDQTLAAFAESWPSLSSLNLCCHTDHFSSVIDPRVPQPEPQRPTFRSLVTFAERCKHLRALRLPLLHVSPEDIAGPSPSSDHGLNALGICRASVTDARACALAVARLFPHLDTSASFSESLCVNSFTAGSSGWHDVLVALQGIQEGEGAEGAGFPPVVEA